MRCCGLVLCLSSWLLSRGYRCCAAVPKLGGRHHHESLNSEQRILIINGTSAAKDRYPYFVTLNHYGGGALIAPDVVLTAGHCKPHKGQTVELRVGIHSFKHDQEDVDYEQFEIAEMVRHPGWIYVNDDEFILDFLLLKLNGRSTKQPIRINRNDGLPVDGQQVTAMGTGNTNPNYESKADVLQEVTLDYISNEVCSESADLDRNLTYQGHIFPSMMCTTGGPHNERDACSYDSGSPIIVPGGGPQQDLLVGLVSWGELCADPSFPGVNARVSEVSDWIDETVCSLSDNPPVEFCATSKGTYPIKWSSMGSWKARFMFGIVLVACAIVTVCYIVNAPKKPAKKSSQEQETLFQPGNTYSKHDSYDSIEALELK